MKNIVKTTKEEEEKMAPSEFLQYHKARAIWEVRWNEKFIHSSPKGRWLYGAPGVGKTYSVRAMVPDLYLKAANKWWDGYKG